MSPSPVTSLLQPSPPSPCPSLRYDDVQPNFPSKVIRSSQKHFVLLNSCLATFEPRHSYLSSPSSHSPFPASPYISETGDTAQWLTLAVVNLQSDNRSSSGLNTEGLNSCGTEGKSLSIQEPLCPRVLPTTSPRTKTFWGPYQGYCASTSGQKEMLEEGLYHGSLPASAC